MRALHEKGVRPPILPSAETAYSGWKVVGKLLVTYIWPILAGYVRGSACVVFFSRKAHRHNLAPRMKGCPSAEDCSYASRTVVRRRNLGRSVVGDFGKGCSPLTSSGYHRHDVERGADEREAYAR
jgi:hypothetical protein